MTESRKRGGALLAVLWLSAALSAIAFSVANTVRGETERTATATDGVRAYYLAVGAVERGILYLTWQQHRNPDGSPRYWDQWIPALRLSFPTGEAVVEVIPATARLSLNQARAEDFFRLLVSLGLDPQRAGETAMAIVDWRTPLPPGRPGEFDPYYLSQTPSFRARHASFEQIEELLLVKGVTPELFHGTYIEGPDGRLISAGGLKDCVSVYGTTGPFDINSASPALLASLELGQDLVQRIVETRRVAPFRSEAQLAEIRQIAGPAAARLRIGGNTIYTLRATARLRVADGQLSDLRRSVSAVIKLTPRGWDAPYQVLRWYDNAPAAGAWTP